LPFECLKNCQKLAIFIFKNCQKLALFQKIAIVNFWKTLQFLALFIEKMTILAIF